MLNDTQSLRNTAPSESKGYDAGKKVSGIKRHPAVGSQGLPHLPPVSTANSSDKAGAKERLQAKAWKLKNLQAVLVDGGDDGQPFADFVREHSGVSVQVTKRSEPHTFAALPKR